MTTLRILHSSDIHGRYKSLLSIDEPFDLWLDTGDFFPNRGRVPGTGYAIVDHMERRYQMRWWGLKKLGSRFAAWLNHRPMMYVAGNHDFVDLGNLLRRAGAPVLRIEPDGVEAHGLTWAGFRQIPSMCGEWPGEVEDFADLVEQTRPVRPDVLVTHAPPAEAAVRDGYGIPGLLAAHPGATTHFFGHDHAGGGQLGMHGNTRTINGAERAVIHTVEIP